MPNNRIHKETKTDQQQTGSDSFVQKQTAQLRSFQPPDSGINFTIQKKENKTGLPDHLKSGIENLSGMDLSDVKVHYNSAQPAQLNAHAYAQGNQIHVASGQEKHLAHEAWHVVQQKQGRVKPTKQLKSAVPVNDDQHLEKEADVMGAKALSVTQTKNKLYKPAGPSRVSPAQLFVLQRIVIDIAPGEHALGQEHLPKRPFSEDQLIQDAEEKKDDGDEVVQAPHANPKLTPHTKGGGIAGFFGVEDPEKKQQREQVQVKLSSVNFSDVGVKEPVIIVGHGLTRTTGKVVNAIAQQGYSVDDFYKVLQTLPKGYSSTVYLQGCYTASGEKKNFSDAFGMQLFQKLVKLFPAISVKGNLGASYSEAEGIRIDHKNEGELDRMRENYRELYKPLFDKLQELNTALTPLFKYSKQGELDALRVQLKQKEEQVKHLREYDLIETGKNKLTAMLDKRKEDASKYAEAEAKLQKSASTLDIEIEQATEQIKEHRKSLQAEKVAFEKTGEHQAWQDKADQIQSTSFYKTLAKLNKDLETGIVSFFDMSKVQALE
jgi:hypothetical protein